MPAPATPSCSLPQPNVYALVTLASWMQPRVLKATDHDGPMPLRHDNPVYDASTRAGLVDGKGVSPSRDVLDTSPDVLSLVATRSAANMASTIRDKATARKQQQRGAVQLAAVKPKLNNAGRFSRKLHHEQGGCCTVAGCFCKERVDLAAFHLRRRVYSCNAGAQKAA